MKIRRWAYNIYLLAALALVSGCESSKDKPEKQLTTLGLFLETNPDDTGRSHTVPVFRAKPMLVNVEKAPFLDERFVQQATLVDSMGGFLITIKFDPHGIMVLNTISAGNPGKHIAIEADFDNQIRWLNAPLIKRRIEDGVLSFTPDATREEAERIVRGLNNAAIKNKLQPKPGAAPKL